MSAMTVRFHISGNEGLGPFRAGFLEQIDKVSSIASAARTLKVSRSEAHRTVKILNTIFLRPLIETKRGGLGMGGAVLTPLGKEVLGLFREAETAAMSATQEHTLAIQRLTRNSKTKTRRAS